ncbi:MAG: hypothetical protein EBV58_03945 [Actinobacteria bacterium]|nr:hypothetical protein [Actinomycetota bacterium]
MNNLQWRLWQMTWVVVFSTLTTMAHANETILPGAKPSSTQRYQVWGFEIYDARLWTSPGFSRSCMIKNKLSRQS